MNESVEKLLEGGFKAKDKWDIVHNGCRYIHQINEKVEQSVRKNIRYLNLDGTYVTPEPPVQVEPTTSATTEEETTSATAEEETNQEGEVEEEDENMEEGTETQGADDGEGEGETSIQEPDQPQTSTQNDDQEMPQESDVVEITEVSNKDESEKLVQNAETSVDPYSIVDVDAGTKSTPIDLTDGVFETLDEYKHVDDDDVVLIDDGHPDSKKAKADIVKEAEVKQKREEKRKAEQAKRIKKEEFFKRLGVKRDGDVANLAPRDVETLQCEWVVLDRALDLCPHLKTIHETKIFQENLGKFLQEIGQK
jgi:hypothetical protein